MKYYNLVVDNRSRITDMTYTYSGPDGIPTGTIVSVPFGKGNRLKLAVVCDEIQIPEMDNAEDIEIKAIDSILTDFTLTKEAVDTAMWMTSRYGIRRIDALRLFFPQGTKAKKKQPKDFVKEVCPEGMKIEKLTREQEDVINNLLKCIPEKDTYVNDVHGKATEIVAKKRNTNVCSAEQGRTITKAYLVHGVTGSGKTEVYFQVISRILDAGLGAIYLVPEITHINQVLRRLVSRFGHDRIAVFHSRLTPSQRFYQWHKISSGKAKIALGTRSAAFAPLEHIGVIIMDEEHENAYKSDMNPKYDTIDVAYKRASLSNALLILGSATPSVVSYYRAEKGIYKLLKLKKRFNEVPLPEMEVVDMNTEMRQGNLGIISGRLYEEIRKNVESGKQAILFVNRRDYTKKVEETCDRLFSDLNVIRLDMDIAGSGNIGDKILDEFELGLHDILIGTQIIAKSIDYKNVGLVGIISADTSIKSGDYRGGERTFQLITQVSGRAGRGRDRGKVIIQTMNPDSFYIKSAVDNDYETFYRREIAIRDGLMLPPFSDIVEIALSGKTFDACMRKMHEYLDYIGGINTLRNLDILSPKEDLIFRGDGKSRVVATCKCPRNLRSVLVATVGVYGKKLAYDRDGTSIMLDINPY
ncbi:MAG: primosomal protein N' [Clostridiales bacterium]|nr:primosomal protein N' [Clostridiales bacterium]